MTNSHPAAETVKKEVLFHGIPASPGIGIGHVLLAGVIASAATAKADPDKRIPQSQVSRELELFQSAKEKTKNELRELQKRLRDAGQEREAEIFDAQLLIVEDRMLNTETAALVEKNFIPASAAVSQVLRKYIEAISSVQDSYLQERAGDVKDVASRILKNLTGIQKSTAITRLDRPTVIIARDLTPSDTAMMDRQHIIGFAVEKGSRTSHTAILARSLQIPAVVGMQHFFERLSNGDRIIIDGFLGMVIVNPAEETLEFYRMKMERKEKLYSELLQESRMRAETLDGYGIQLLGNVEGSEGAPEVLRCGGEGVGLFRTEYLFMNTNELPGEERQFEEYRKIAKEMSGRPVVIRTFDLGGDKLDGNLAAFHEANPFLGERAIRLTHSRPALMQTQLRAILRASAFGNLKLLFPMVSSEDELDELLEIVRIEKEKLVTDKIPFNRDIEVGIMIEIPSAAIMAEHLAKKVDFFSIGSNDLVQYTLAVDRGNEKVAYLYRPGSAAILSLIADTTKAARAAGIYVCTCGEIAGDPIYAPLLIGLGVQELSMSAAALTTIRRVIRRMKIHEAENLAKKALACSSASDAHSLASEYLRSIAPDLVS